MLHALADRGITRLMVEGGARVASSFVSAGLVDEIWLLRGRRRSALTASLRWTHCRSRQSRSRRGFRLVLARTLDSDTLTIYERIYMFTGIVTDIGEIAA